MSEIEKMYIEYYVEKDELRRRLDEKECNDLVASMKKRLKGAFQNGDTSDKHYINSTLWHSKYSNKAIECAMRRIKSDGATVEHKRPIDSCEYLAVSFERSHS
jgi:hypothetical protein